MVYERCFGCTVPLCHDIFSPSSIMLAEVERLWEKPEPTSALQRPLLAWSPGQSLGDWFTIVANTPDLSVRMKAYHIKGKCISNHIQALQVALQAFHVFLAMERETQLCDITTFRLNDELEYHKREDGDQILWQDKHPKLVECLMVSGTESGGHKIHLSI